MDTTGYSEYVGVGDAASRDTPQELVVSYCDLEAANRCKVSVRVWVCVRAGGWVSGAGGCACVLVQGYAPRGGCPVTTWRRQTGARWVCVSGYACVRVGG